MNALSLALPLLQFLYPHRQARITDLLSHRREGRGWPSPMQLIDIFE